MDLQYRLTGNLSQLCIPAMQLSAVSDELWRHTCFEAFIGVMGESAYWEFNFSPSGQWAVYVFRNYRKRDPLISSQIPQITVTEDRQKLELTATITSSLLPILQTGKVLQLGLNAVIETIDGSQSYWALRHPSERPDFHHRDGFVYQLTV